MKHFYFFLILLVTIPFTNTTNAQAPAIEWQKSLGGNDQDIANSINTTTDGGYIVAGASISAAGDVNGNHGNYDFWIVKLNSVGAIDWSKTFGGSMEDRAFSIQQTSDGGYIAAGFSASVDGDVTNRNGGIHSWIVKLTSTGNLQWEKSFGGIGNSQTHSIRQTTDGGYILAGFSNAVISNHGLSDAWVLKLDHSGVLQWEKTLGGSKDDYANSIHPTVDGGYVLAGTTFSNDGDVAGSHGNIDYWVVKLTSTGNIEWQKCLGGSLPDYAEAIEQTKDGGYIVAGSSYSADGEIDNNKGDRDYWIVKLNNLGSIQWKKNFGGTGADWCTSIRQTPDGGFITAGKSISANGDVTGNKGDFDYWVLKITANGTIEWQKSMGGELYEETHAIVSTPDGGYIVAGASSSPSGDITDNHGYLDYWIVKLVGGDCVPTINIISTSTTICSGASVIFTANATSTGANPIYQWKVNGVNTGTNSATFTSSALNDNDIITCHLTSNAPCAATSSVTSNSIKISVNPSPVVFISGDTCVGAIMTANSNLAPASLRWTLNGNTKVANQTAGISANAVTIAGGNGPGANGNQLNKPARFFIDASGNMYIPDMNNNRIQKWAPGAASGITVAGGNGTGSGNNQFDRPTSVAIDSKGNMYVTDQSNNRVMKYAPAAPSGTRFGYYFSTPTDVFIDADDNIYISEQNNSLVTKIPAGSSSGTTVAGGHGYGSGPGELSSPTGIFVDPSGNIYICDTDNDRVQKWAPGASTGITVAGGNGHGSGANQLANPLGVFVDSYGNVYVCDYNNARVQRWAPNATSGITVAGGNGAGLAANQLDHPETILIDANGDLIVCDLGNHRIQKFSNSLIKTYTTLSAGDYTATITSAKGCTTTSNVIKVVASKTGVINITSNGTAVCPQVPVTFTASATYGGNAPVYQWKINGTNTGTPSNNSTFSSAGLKAGDVVSCEMTSNANICLTSKSVASNAIKLTAAAAGIASIKISASDSTICKGAKITFSATTNNGGTAPAYNWKVNGVSVNNTTATFSPASLNEGDSVSCIVTSNANLCPGNLTATSNVIAVHVLNVPVTSITISASDSIICAGTPVNLKATAVNGGSNAFYQWKVNGVNAGFNNASLSANSFVDGDAISCMLTSSIACAAPNPATSNIVKMTVDTKPVLTIRPDTVIFLGGSIKLNTVATGRIATYQWSPSISLDNPVIKDPVATPASTTTYRLLVTTPGNCKVTGQVTIKTITEVIITNAFSPNGDGINDVWNIPGLSSYPDGSVQIFNRYGALVFESKGYNKPWDGTFKGQPMPVGTYYYIIATDKVYGKKSGSVTLLR